jgi:hypothetical protein
MNYTPDILNEVIQLSAKGKSVFEIASYLFPEDPQSMVLEFNDKTSELSEAFLMGCKQMGPDIKLVSAQAELEIMKVNRTRAVDALISDYLGENSEEEE